MMGIGLQLLYEADYDHISQNADLLPPVTLALLPAI